MIFSMIEFFFFNFSWRGAIWDSWFQPLHFLNGSIQPVTAFSLPVATEETFKRSHNPSLDGLIWAGLCKCFLFSLLLRRTTFLWKNEAISPRTTTTHPSYKHFVPCESSFWLHTKHLLPAIKVENFFFIFFKWWLKNFWKKSVNAAAHCTVIETSESHTKTSSFPSRSRAPQSSLK